MTDQDQTERTEERFQVLETKIVYQEQMVEDLNGVVIRQQDQVDWLCEQIRKLEELLKEQAQNTSDEGEEPPPPHY